MAVAVVAGDGELDPLGDQPPPHLSQAARDLARVMSAALVPGCFGDRDGDGRRGGAGQR